MFHPKKHKNLLFLIQTENPLKSYIFLLLRIDISLFTIVLFTHKAWCTDPFCIIVDTGFPLLWLYISLFTKYIAIKKALYDHLILRKHHVCDETAFTLRNTSYHIVLYYIVYCTI